jgi:signal peptidase I
LIQSGQPPRARTDDSSESSAVPISLKPSSGVRRAAAIFIAVPAACWFLTGLYIFLGLGGIGYLSYWAYRWRRRGLQRRLNQSALSVAKSGEFILYLRSFFTSRRLMVRNGMGVIDLILIGRFWDLELALAFAFEKICGVVAIGEKSSSYGAAKITTDNEHWQALLFDLVSRARFVFIVPFASPGTAFEVLFLSKDSASLRKTVFIMPPTYFTLASLMRLVCGRSYRRRWNHAQEVFAREGISLAAYRRSGGLFQLDIRGQPSPLIPTGNFQDAYLRDVASVGDFSDGTFDRLQKIGRGAPDSWSIGLWWKQRIGAAIPVALHAIIIAVVIRTFLFQPFNIPSGSMMATLLIGDYLFVSKYTYGYSHYSFPFSPPLFSGRDTILGKGPQRGDVVVFRLPRDDSIEYIKRVIGLPGDKIQMIDGLLHINGVAIKRERAEDFVGTEDTPGIKRIKRWKETLPEGKSYYTLDLVDNSFYDNTPVYTIPPDHYFMLGDNRDNSADSRMMNQVGYVPLENFVGRVEIIFFSLGDGEAPWKIWRWPHTMRWKRFLTPIR